MRINRQFSGWASIGLGGMCLLLLLNILPQFDADIPHSCSSSVATSRPISPLPVQKASERHKDEPLRASAGLGSPDGNPLRAHPRLIPKPLESKVGSTVAAVPEEPRTEAPVAPSPVTLTPIGYVEKADGQVEAVVADGDLVQLVREGQLFADRYRVLRITPSSVEVAEESPEVAGRSPALERGAGKEPKLASTPITIPHRAQAAWKVDAVPRPRRDESLEGDRTAAFDSPRHLGRDVLITRNLLKNNRMTRDIPTTEASCTDATASVSAAGLKQLGYVEKADGSLQAIMSDGEGVRLLHEGDLLAGDYRVAKVSPSSVEITEEPVLATSQESPTGHASGDMLWPERAHSGMASHAPASPPILRVSLWGSEQPFSGNGQAESVRISLDYRGASGAALTTRGVSLVETTVPSHPASLEHIGYVEWAGGRIQAVISQADQVHIVKAGEILAERYRVQSISRSSVEIVEQSPPKLFRRSLPALPEKRAEPIAGGRRVEMSHSPPGGEVRMVAFRGCHRCRSALKRAESSLAETPRSPPKLTGNLLKSKALERILAATTEDALSARGRSVSSPVQAPLGYVEWGDGRIQVLLAGDGRVCLVPVGDVAADARADVGSSGWPAETAKGSRLAVAQRAPPSSGQGIGQESAPQPAVAMSHSPPPTAIDTFALLEGGGPLGGEQEGPGLEPITEPRAPAFGLRSHVPMLDNRSDAR